jgi:hypothetical protein
MAFTIQNLACFEVELNPNSHRFYFKEDVIKPDMIIDEIFLFFNPWEYVDGEPYTGNPFALKSTDANAVLTYFNAVNTLYANIADKEKEFIVNLPFYQMHVTTANRLQLIQNINRAIDTTKSFFYYDATETIRCLCYITYRTSQKVLNPVMSGSFNIEIDVDTTKGFQDIQLSDYIPVGYEAYKIKKIVTNTPDNGYLDLISESNFIENIPFKLLYDKQPRYDLYFNEITVDYTRSYFRYRKPVIVDDAPTLKFKFTFYY